MWILVTFLLGIGNFALHKAVLESRHPFMDWMAAHGGKAGKRMTLALEFAVLLGAMLLVAYDGVWWGWAYAGYSLVNGIAGWLILARRI